MVVRAYSSVTSKEPHPNEIAVAPYTTDGDLALDPTLLGDDPEL